MKTNSILLEAKETLINTVEILNSLSFDEYTQALPILSNSTLGEHFRHIIEIFQKLLTEYHTGIIDYDQRERNNKIETNIDFAVECIAQIIAHLEKPDKPLLITSLLNKENGIKSSYYREVLYNIEHCIHHQAIIKIGLLYLGKDAIAETFGVAKSTLLYRNACVQ